VLGPPVETTPPTVVFTGPADRPDTVEQTASATPKKKKKVAGKTDGDKSAKPAANATKSAKPAKPAKPKVSATTQ
jgi:D-alanyl-D-alanine carboxypeptidase